MKERVQPVHSTLAEPEGKMGKNMVNKRSKGKVDFKRKEDLIRRPLDEEHDNTEPCNERNKESEIEVIMKKNQVIYIS